MARAHGARAQMALAFETVYGTAPTTGFRTSALLRLTAPVPTVIGHADQHRFTLSAREAL